MYDLPEGLPVPQDDGAANHLVGLKIPSLFLYTSQGRMIDISKEFEKPTVLFIFPRAGSPLEPNDNQREWDLVPGARGCTPQSCAFRDMAAEFKQLGFQLFGLSVQKPLVLAEVAERNHLGFELLSDEKLQLLNELKLPEFVFANERLIKRMAWVVRDSTIVKVFYPVFPPNENAQKVLDWLRQADITKKP